MDYASAPSLLWAHQLKRENHHLLKRIEALERRSATFPAANPDSAPSPAKPTIADIETRLVALEQSSSAATNATAEEAQKQRDENAELSTQLVALRTEMRGFYAGFDGRVEHSCRELERVEKLATQLDKKTASLDIEVSADAATLKQIHKIVYEVRKEATELKDRLWAVENGIANLESQAREDGVRLQSAVQRFRTVEADVGVTSEKLERVFRVAEILIDRDEEVRGRVGALETLAANSCTKLNVAAKQQIIHETTTTPVDEASSMQHQQLQIPTHPGSQDETQLPTLSPIAHSQGSPQPRDATPPPVQPPHQNSLEQTNSPPPAPRTPKRSKKRQRPPTPIPIPTNRTRSQTKAAAISKPNESTQTQIPKHSELGGDVNGKREHEHELIAQGSQLVTNARSRERPMHRERPRERDKKRARRR